MLYPILIAAAAFGIWKGGDKLVQGVKVVERTVVRVATKPFHHHKPKRFDHGAGPGPRL